MPTSSAASSTAATAPTDARPPTTAPPPTTAAPTVAFPAPRRLLVVGDSVAYMMRRAFRHQRPPGMTVDDEGVVGCTPGASDHPQMRFEDGSQILDPCADAITDWPALVQRDGMDGVLMVFGTSGLQRQFGDEWHRPCEPAYDAWFQTSVETNMRALQSSGARVWIALAPYNRHASVSSPDAPGRCRTARRTA